VQAAQLAPSNYMQSRAAPTPVADADGVYATFESGDVFAVDHSGKERWRLNLGEICGDLESNHGLGASPAQNADLLFINVEHGGPSFLFGIDKKSGEVSWKQPRPSGSSWTSPIVRATETGEEVIVSSQGTVIAYQASDGAKVWEVDGLEGNSVPSPCLVGDNIISAARVAEFGSSRNAAESNVCIAPAGNGRESAVLWRADKAVCDYASPVVANGYVYFLNKVGVLYCVSAETGETQYTERLGSECWATPIVAADRIYFFGKNGETKVISSGPEFRLVSTSLLWDLENPPAPETYAENNAVDGHGGHGGHGAEHGEEEASGENGGPRTSRFRRMLLANDTNSDGQIQASELPEAMRERMLRGDTNGDKVLDDGEMTAMEESFRARRAGSRAGSRDPIVYGVAASQDAIVVRTGTRLYCIRKDQTAVRD